MKGFVSVRACVRACVCVRSCVRVFLMQVLLSYSWNYNSISTALENLTQRTDLKDTVTYLYFTQSTIRTSDRKRNIGCPL